MFGDGVGDLGTAGGWGGWCGPAVRSSRAISNRWGRSRLPTWSARNGGLVLRAMGLPLLNGAGIGQVDRVRGYAKRLAEDTAHQIRGHQAVGAGLRGGADRDPDSASLLGDVQWKAASGPAGATSPGPL